MTVNNRKKVFVSGCFDILHSGHIAFLQEASQFGDLYVGLGSDKTVSDLKGRMTVNSEEERLYMIKALSCVHQVKINRGSGILSHRRRSADQSGPGSLRGGDVIRPTFPSNSIPGSQPEGCLGTVLRTGVGSGRRLATVDSAAAFRSS